MKLLAWMLALFMVACAWAQENSETITQGSKDKLFEKASQDFLQGKYKGALEELKIVEQKLKAQKKQDKEKLGLAAYWQGITCNRLQDFPCAIQNFDKALSLGYSPLDINYEYGQALFAAEKLAEARLQFKESVKKNFKRPVSLYYLGFISKEMGEKKQAFAFFKALNKLDPAETKDVLQAAEMQVGDIYLEQMEKHPDTFRAVETYVIPQYEKALAVNPESPLAPSIKEKIISLQRKYDLILFQLRNGRPVLQPPYFMRAAVEYAHDTNVIFAPTETTVSKSDQSSDITRYSAMGRYTFYYQDFLSIAPEASFTYTRHLNRIPAIYRNDNMVLGAALRNAYEHKLFGKAASTLFDWDYTEIKRDINAEKKLEFNSRAHGLMVGERFSYFSKGETVVRLRYRMNDSYLDSQDSKTTSLAFEQVVGLTDNTLLLNVNYDMVRMEDNTFDTNALTIRGDLIMSRVRDWFTPSIGLALTSTDPINDRDARGRELLVNPNVRLAKTFGKNLRGNLKWDHQKYDSKDDGNFSYKKTTYGIELEYLF